MDTEYKHVATIETRVCAECGAPLPSGVADVFCPECALRGALGGGKQAGEGTLLRWFRQLTARKQEDKNSVPSAQTEWRQSLPMTTVAPAPGDVIGDYEILERIGGNMGLVYKARHRLLDKVVVLKMVPAELIADSARLTRFQREMRVMGQLEHPNLVTAADARSVGEWHLVVMELIDGVDLQQVVRAQGPLSVAAACEVARQAALGLQYAHEHGLIHRDIKPSNLMLTRAGIIKVIDMGLALIRDDSTAQLTQTGFLLGTMSYCAPEQFRDAAHVDIRADIYSLGCTLYHLLTGKSPYWQRKTFPEIVEAHLHEPFPRLAEALPEVSAKLGAVLARMTAKDRDERFSTPREVVEALEPFVRGADLAPLVPASAPKSPQRGAPMARVLSSPERQGATRHVVTWPKRPWIRVAALLVLLLAIAGAVFLALNRSPHGPFVPARERAVIVVIDTAADGGVYDEKNKGKGITNGEEIRNALEGLPVTTRPEHISIHWIDMLWRGEVSVINNQPDAVLIHRSSPFHPIAAEMGLKYPPFSESELTKSNNFEFIYRLCDVALTSFLANIGSQSPRTRFLIYSRGTDPNWTNKNYRMEWVKNVEERFPWLKGRISTMWIQEGKDGSKASFRNPETAEAIRNWVKTNAILRLKAGEGLFQK